MRWFSHRRREPRPWGRLQKKMLHFFVFFVRGDLDLWPLTLTLELGRVFCTMHPTAESYPPTFNRSEVIVLTNRQTDRQTDQQTDAAENIHLAPLCYAGGQRSCIGNDRLQRYRHIHTSWQNELFNRTHTSASGCRLGVRLIPRRQESWHVVNCVAGGVESDRR